MWPWKIVLGFTITVLINKLLDCGLWVSMLCHLVGDCAHFGGTYYLHVQNMYEVTYSKCKIAGLFSKNCAQKRITKLILQWRILISFIPCSVYKSNVYDFPTTFIHLYWELSHTRFAVTYDTPGAKVEVRRHPTLQVTLNVRQYKQLQPA
jgi:hypothetical protein